MEQNTEPDVRAVLLHTGKHNAGLTLVSAQTVSTAGLKTKQIKQIKLQDVSQLLLLRVSHTRSQRSLTTLNPEPRHEIAYSQY